MELGVVRKYMVEKGYGFIIRDDGQQIFVHQSNIMKKGFRKLFEGAEVQFTSELTEKGLNALNVQVIG